MDSTHSSAAGHPWSATDTTDICPISIECGLVPRKSVDVSRESASDMGEGHRQPGACAGPSGRPVGWVPSAGNALHHLRSHAQPTPAELLAADATLNIAQLMDAAPLKRGGSLQLRRGTSQTRPSSDAVLFGTEQGWDSPGESELQLTQQQQQLAAACRARDARLLQHLLAAGVQTSAALDAGGNTALHLLLLPAAVAGSAGDADAATAAAAAPAAAPAVAAVEAAGVEITDVVMVDASSDSAHSPDKRRSGGFSWLAGCFGGSSADLTDIPSTSSCASSQHSSSSRTFLMRSHGAAAATAAAAPPQAPLVASLIAAGAAVNVRNREGRTPLMLAVAQIAALCGAAAPCTAQINASLRVLDIFCKTPLVDLNMQDAAGRTALSLVLAAAPGPPRGGSAASSKAASSRHQPQPQFASPAASAAQLRAVQLLMSAGADCNSTDRAGMTPLMHAAANPGICRPLLDHLLANGANARLLDNQRRSALTHALYAQNLLVAPQCGRAYELFLQGHYSLQQQQQPDAAAPAGPGCSDGRSNASGSEPNSSSRSNATADLHASISVTPPIPVPRPNHGAIIRALCSYGALDLHPSSINTRFPALNYRTQLHIAMRRGDVRALEMLLAGGADVNARDAWGNTPLMYWPVAPSQPEELVEQLVVKLLAQGASPRIANNEGWLPLDLACELTKLGRVLVRPTCVPVHATLTGFGAKNSEAFLCQARHQQPMLLCMRCDSDTEGLMRLGKTWGSIKRAPAAAEDEGYGCATVLE